MKMVLIFSFKKIQTDIAIFIINATDCFCTCMQPAVFYMSRDAAFKHSTTCICTASTGHLSERIDLL